MSRAAVFETIVGVGVIAVAAIFLVFAYTVSGKDIARGAYNLTAVFGRVDGVTIGSEVRIAGVKVGTVSGHALDTDTFEARLRLSVAAGVPVPEDSTAKIVTDGLLGGAHVSIEPGGSEYMLEEGDAITITQGSVDLLGLAVKAFTENAAARGDKAGRAEDSPGGL